MFGLFDREKKKRDQVMQTASRIIALHIEAAGLRDSLSIDHKLEVLSDDWVLGYIFGYAEAQLTIVGVLDDLDEGWRLIGTFMSSLFGGTVGAGILHVAMNLAIQHPLINDGHEFNNARTVARREALRAVSEGSRVCSLEAYVVTKLSTL